MGKMSREDLFREIGEIDETYVEEAQRAGRRHKPLSWTVRSLAAAASLVLCMGVGYMALQLMHPKGNNGGAMADAVSEADRYNMAGAAQGINGDAVGNEGALEQYPEESTECQALDAITEEEAAEMQADGDRAVDQSGAAQEMAPAEVPPLTNDMREDLADTESKAGQQGMVEQLVESEKETSTSGAMDLIWEAARTDTVYGRYVDVQVPEGYSYDSGVHTASGLQVIWSKGMEEISISCRQADETVSDWLVDIDNPEEYDLGLYTIPWADSVPENLIQKLNDAVFRPDQITQEIVTARSYQVQEQGDVSGWRTRISILYNDNVLVEIRSKGPAPEEVYELINQEGENLEN